MSLRILMAIHSPADARTAVYRTMAGHADHLRSAGHDVTLLAADDLRWASPRLDPWCLPGALATRGLAQYDVVIFHSYLGYAFHALRSWLDPLGRAATITSFHGLEPLYFNALDRELSQAGQPLSTRFRVMYGTVMPRLLRMTCRASDAVFCLNSNESRYLVEQGWARPDRVHVLPNGVEPECFRAPAEPERPGELLFVGQWLPAKGIRYLAQAFVALAARRPDVRLACVGTGAQSDVVLAAFPEAVRGRVRVLPSVDREGLYAAFRSADVFVFPTLSEGFSKALLEAMAAGLPIVTTPVGAAPDLLRSGENATLVPCSDAAAVETAVGRYLDDRACRSRHAEAARATAERYRENDVGLRWTEQVAAVAERRAAERRWRSGRRNAVG